MKTYRIQMNQISCKWGLRKYHLEVALIFINSVVVRCVIGKRDIKFD